MSKSYYVNVVYQDGQSRNETFKAKTHLVDFARKRGLDFAASQFPIYDVENNKPVGRIEKNTVKWGRI